MSEPLVVKELYGSFQGEGVEVGVPVTILRLFGCNRSCSWCDAPLSRSGPAPTPRKVAEVAEVIQRVYPQPPLVLVTGGEPLLQWEGLRELCDRLSYYRFALETNGSVEGVDPVDVCANFRTVTVSPKDGIERTMALEQEWWRAEDGVTTLQFKYVVRLWEEVEWYCSALLKMFDEDFGAPALVAFQPLWGAVEFGELWAAAQCADRDSPFWRLTGSTDVRILPQLHKVAGAR